jgi:hypothetical protein
MVDHARTGHTAADTRLKTRGLSTLDGGRTEKEGRPPLSEKSRISGRKNAQTLVKSAK